MGFREDQGLGVFGACGCEKSVPVGGPPFPSVASLPLPVPGTCLLWMPGSGRSPLEGLRLCRHQEDSR